MQKNMCQQSASAFVFDDHQTTMSLDTSVCHREFHDVVNNVQVAQGLLMVFD